MRSASRSLFPVSLYATLLLALCCLWTPELSRWAQERVRALQTWPLRFVVGWWSQPSVAPALSAGFSESVERRLVRSALQFDRRLIPAGLVPLPCRVVATEGRGGAGLPAVLVLDRPAKDLRGCAGFVTLGDQLVGFLASASEGPGRVVLLHASASSGFPPRPVPASVEIEGAALRFLVEPASQIDQWPLQCRLLDDPCLAARLQHSGGQVRSEALAGDPLGLVPSRLGLGTLRVLGYPGEHPGPPIGLFVQPAVDPRAIAIVVLWQTEPETGETLSSLAPPKGAWHQVRCVRLPAPPPMHERWLLLANDRTPIPVGAAVVRSGQLLGIVDHGAAGHAYLSPFGRAHGEWSLLVLPRAGSSAPLPIRAKVVGTSAVKQGAERVVLAKVGGPVDRSGTLFTGPNGPHCPSGLWVGWAEATGQTLQVTRIESEEASAAVFLGDPEARP